jgi:hypothetical protein
MNWSRSDQSWVKEIPWLAKNCRPNKLRRGVLSANGRCPRAHRAPACTKVRGTNRRSPAQRPSFMLGKWSILYRLGWFNGPRLEHDRDVIIRRPSRTCTFQGDAAFQAKGYNVHASESAPTGARGLCPACGGETSIRLIAPTNAHGVERRTFECKQCHARQAFIVARENGTTHLMRH